MLEQLKKLIVLNRNDFYLCTGVVGGVFVLTQLIIAAVMFIAKPEDGVRVSALILVICGGVMMLVVSLANIMILYIQAIQFGCTRRRGLLLTLGVTGAEYLTIVPIILLAQAVEQYLCPGFWQMLAGRTMELTFYMDGIQPPWWLILAAPLAGAALGLVISAVIQRFGRIGGWFLWGLWMVVCIGPSLLPWDHLQFSFPWLLPAGGVLCAALTLWAVWTLLHTSVKA